MKTHFYCFVSLATNLCMADAPISLDAIAMNVVQTDACGVVNHETVFRFSQKDNLVQAVYAGGQIEKGFLIGRFDEPNHLLFTYCQIQLDGTLDNGVSRCEVSKDEEGKILLTEHFEWASRPGEMGINIFKEL